MNELELLILLQKIKEKLNNNQELPENETKLLATILFGLALGFMEQTTRLLLEKLKKKKVGNHKQPEGERK